MTVRLVSVVGARPEFIQVGAIARAIERLAPGDRPFDHHLVHTGQHYDFAMSTSFFADAHLPTPTHNLGVGSRPAAAQIGEMLTGLSEAFEALRPDIVVVYGDTNSTLAGALAAAKQGIPVAHVESGLRSFNLAMPEELNRRVTDHLARYKFCPSPTAVANLAREGITTDVHLTGDVNYESLNHDMPSAAQMGSILEGHGVEPGEYVVATLHRAENADNPRRLHEILLALSDVANDGFPVIFPVHPRTKASVENHAVHSGVKLIDPVTHPEMIALVKSSSLLMTDSGGLQKEAYWLATPCVTMRDETEWVETLGEGWNLLAGANRRSITESARAIIRNRPSKRPPLYGEGTRVSDAILARLADPGAGSLGVEAS